MVRGIAAIVFGAIAFAWPVPYFSSAGDLNRRLSLVDWHNAPRRQYVITLAGGVEIGLGDGSLHRFGPGEGILAEDLTGKGHTTRAVGDEPRVMMIVPLKD